MGHVSEFNTLGVFWINQVQVWQCHWKVTSRKKVAGAISSLVNSNGLQLECDRVLHETLLMPVLIYGSETLIWKEKESSRIKAVQIDNLRSLPGIKRMFTVSNAWIRELCTVTKGVVEGIMKMFSGGSTIWR